MFSHLLSRVMTWASGVEGGAPWDIMLSTLQKKAALGHKRESPDVLCPIPLPPDAVLLGCEDQRGKVGSLEVDCRGCDCKEAAAATEGSILEAEQGAL